MLHRTWLFLDSVRDVHLISFPLGFPRSHQLVKKQGRPVNKVLDQVCHVVYVCGCVYVLAADPQLSTAEGRQVNPSTAIRDDLLPGSSYSRGSPLPNSSSEL